VQECVERRGRVRQVRRNQGRDCLFVEDLALNGGDVDDGALVVAQAVEPGGEERLDRRWNGELAGGRAVLERECEHLLHEERVAFADLDRPLPRPFRERAAGEVVDQLDALGLRERLEQDRGRVQLPASPAGAHVEQVRPGEADQQDRDVPRPVGQVLDEVEEDRLSPVDVVEDKHDGLPPCRRLEQRPHRCEAGLDPGRGLDQPDRLRDPQRDVVGVRLAGERRLQLGPGLVG
jgi:hypothetical protein